MFTLKSELQDKGDLLKQSGLLYRHAFWIVLPYSLIAAGFIFSPQLILGITHRTSTPFEYHSHFTAIILCSTLMTMLFLAALIFRLYGFCYQVPSHFFQSLRQALFKLIPLILLGALYAMIILGGTMLLVVPGVLLTYSLLFSFILLITGNQTVLQTLITSYRLVQNHWWNTFLVINFAFLFAIVVSLGVFVLTASIVVQFSLPTQAMIFVVFLANILAQACLIPFVFSVALVLLHDLRLRYSAKRPSW